jgi:hypothetical protein
MTLSPERALWQAIVELAENGAFYTKTFGNALTQRRLSTLSFCRRGLWNEQELWEREVEGYESTEIWLCRQGTVEMPC